MSVANAVLPMPVRKESRKYEKLIDEEGGHKQNLSLDNGITASPRWETKMENARTNDYEHAVISGGSSFLIGIR